MINETNIQKWQQNATFGIIKYNERIGMSGWEILIVVTVLYMVQNQVTSGVWGTYQQNAP